jgi:recombination protein RecT
VYGGKMSLQVSVEGIMFLAKRVEGYQGVDVQLVYENDEYKAKRVRGVDGRYFWDVEHEISGDPGKVIGCYAFAYREGFPPVFEYLKAEEVQHNLKGNNSSLWNKYYNDMFKKHVLKRAAKRQYGIEINEDEVPSGGSSDVPEYQPKERKDITPDQTPKTESEVVKTPIDEAKEQMQVKFAQLGIEGRDEKRAYIEKHLPNASNPPTLQELTGLLTIMDMDIERRQSTDVDELE